MAQYHRIASSASLDRLERLIEERLAPGADTAAIDRRIWNLFGERWAVMFTDLTGFSRQVAEFGIIHFLQTIQESQRLLLPCIEACGGILLKTEGDSLFVIFRQVDDAIDAAIRMQRALHAYNADRAQADQVLLGIGLGYGDVLRIGDSDVFGAEVNAAAKLGEDHAQAWEILVTAPVREAASVRAGIEFERYDRVPAGTTGAYRLKYAA